MDCYLGAEHPCGKREVYGLAKFKRFAVNVWDVDPKGKSDEQIAEEGLKAMGSWMKELGLVMNISELGVTEERKRSYPFTWQSYDFS